MYSITFRMSSSLRNASVFADFENLDYDKLSSLSAVLPFIAVTTKPVINMIDLDKIEDHPAFMKLFYHLLNENSFKPNLLKININDFDDWDYEYKLYED